MSILLTSKVKKIWANGVKVKKAYLGEDKLWVSSVQIAVPVISGTYTYDSSEQTPLWSGYDSTKMTIGGTTSATNAGTYTATFTPKEGYSWDEDGDDTAARNVSWSIARLSIANATITLDSTTLTYNNANQTKSVTSVKVGELTATYSVSGNTGKNAGNYTLTCTGTGNYQGTKTASWKIERLSIANAVITLGGTPSYNGSVRTQSITSVKVGSLTATYSVSGNTATNVGSYTLTCTGTGNYQGSKTAAWSIKKGSATITPSVQSISIASGTTSTSFTVSRTGDGTISVSSSNTDIATVSGTTSVTVTKQGTGTTTIVITTSETSNYFAGSTSISCSCTYAIKEVTRSITSLSLARSELTAGVNTSGGYLIFAGGYNGNASSYYQSTVDVYDSSLTGGALTTGLANARASLSAARVGGYVLVAGGYYINSQYYYPTAVDAFNASRVRSAPASGLSVGRNNGAATTIGSYALFAGGIYWGSSSEYTLVANADAYNASLTRYSNTLQLGQARCALSATTVGSFALFAGGGAVSYDRQYYSNVDSYNQSLTHTTLASPLTYSRAYIGSTQVGNYALFAGGFAGSSPGFNDVDAYDSSLTKIATVAPLTYSRNGIPATTVGGCAIFAGGNTGVGCYYLDAYDKTLTKITTSLRLNNSRRSLAAGTIGDYAVFAGGYGSSYSAAVEAFTYN